MEILVLSDSHGRVDHMVRAVEQFHPRQVLHLGDCVRDAQALERQFPQLPVTMVPGNWRASRRHGRCLPRYWAAGRSRCSSAATPACS